MLAISAKAARRSSRIDCRTATVHTASAIVTRCYHRHVAMNAVAGDDVALARGAALFRGLADRSRLAILTRLAAGERRVVDLVGEVGLAQATVSKHLACLRGCGLVEGRPEGRQVFYSLAHPELFDLLVAAEAVLERTGAAVALCPAYGVAHDAATTTGGRVR